MPTSEVAATVRNHHVHQVLSAFNSLSKLYTLALDNAKGAASGRSRDYVFRWAESQKFCLNNFANASKFADCKANNESVYMVGYCVYSITKLNQPIGQRSKYCRYRKSLRAYIPLRNFLITNILLLFLAISWQHLDLAT